MAGEQQQQTPVTTAIEENDVSFVSSSNGGSSGVQALTPLAFDESLVAALTTACSGTESATSMSNSKSAADFFLDQIAAVVSDEKKLSDNIMDLIPPVEAFVSQGDAVTQGTSARGTSSIDIPLQPPPGLMMRALSPPTSLLPDFGDVASLSLLGDAMVSGSMTASSETIARPTTTTTTTTVTTAVKRELQGVKPGDLGTTATGAVYKKQKTDNVKLELVVKEAAASVPVSVHPQTQQQQARHHLHINNNPLELTAITGLAPDTPAANSGICVGDTLVAVSGLPVRGLQFSTVIGRLKSTSRNSVVLKLRRNPFRQTAGSLTSYRGMKRPGRSVIKGPDSSNSANVLSSRTMALETRMSGRFRKWSEWFCWRFGRRIEQWEYNHPHDAEQLQMQLKLEPMNSTYFPTDASTLTMGATDLGSNSSNAVPPSIFVPSSSDLSGSQTGWRVNSEEKDRYYAECRALRHELGRSMIAQRIKKRDTATYTSQLQAVVDKFQEQVRSLESASSAAAHASAMEALPVASTTINSDEVAALRQKLVKANQTLAKQQTEILALQEREARHALPEAQRVKWQLVSNMRQSLLQIDCKAASKWSSTLSVKRIGVSSGPTSNFEKRLDGVRPCSFALLVGQTSVKIESPTVELELSATACMELLGWNLREVVVQAARTYTVSVVDSVHVKYMRTEEALVASWTLCVKDNSSNQM
ncbi:unnamed protein product [Peronospora destructor]|uniref:PDZ domain-containing protein n=1 Tax=Peronospora destructor TaxID=86335 RepID=A0AAV0SX54_9STRA|nr:unnamed protein product [Peronospora destructor]